MQARWIDRWGWGVSGWTRRVVFSTLLVLLGVASAGCPLEPVTYTPLPPTVPQPRLPRNDVYEGSTITGALRPRFGWEASTLAKGEIRYELQYSADPTFTTGVTSVETAETSYQPEANLPVATTPPVGRRYYWRLRACSAKNCSDYSRPWWVNLGRSDKDFNGDGYADVVVGAESNDDNGRRDAGRVYVYFGGPGSTFDTTADSPLGSLVGAAPDDRFGTSVASAGDFNGDGFADLIIGARNNSAAAFFAGQVYIYFGAPGVRFEATADVTLTGTAQREQFGMSVSSAGDVNADGFADVVVGAPGNSAGGTDAGRAYLYFGGAKGAFDGADGILTGIAAGNKFGSVVRSAGDIDGDGYSDVIVAAQYPLGGAQPDCRTYLYLGGSGLAFDASLDFEFSNDAANYCSPLLDGNADVNHDGFADVLASADQGASVPGHMLLYLGRKGASPDSVRFPMGNTSAGAVRNVSFVGDVNGDSSDDLAIGTGDYSLRSSIYLGRPGGEGPVVETPAAILAGRYANDGYGLAMSGAGDLNGDGFDDVVVGAKLDDASGTFAGRVYVYFGNAGGSIEPSPDGILDAGAPESFFGFSVATGGFEATAHRRLARRVLPTARLTLRNRKSAGIESDPRRPGRSEELDD